MVAKQFWIIFGCIGAVLLLIALGFAINSALFIAGAASAQGTVVEAAPPGSTYKSTALIEFTASNGQIVRFRSGVSSSPPEFTRSQQVKVYYKTSDPAGTAQADSLISMWFFSLLCGFLGAVFGGIGVFCFIVWLSDRKRRQWLLANGQRITARITLVQKNEWVRRMGKAPYYLLAQGNDPLRKTGRTFRSGSIWNLPPYFVPGAEVSVLVDPNNPQRYLVELPPEAVS